MKLNYKKIIYESLIILLLSILVGIFYNTFSKNGIPFIYKPIMLESGSFITLEDAYRLNREGQAIFLDSRSHEEYTTGHIRGAVNLPINGSREEKVKILINIPKERLVVTYCDGSECKSSSELARELMQIGYRRVVIFLGGLNEWKKSGNPIE